MTIRFFGSIAPAAAVAAALAWAPAPAAAQSAAAKGQAAAIPRLHDGKPNFNGIWDRPRIVDVTRNGNTCGSGSQGCKQEGNGELSYTPWGLEQWNDKHKFDYAAYCQPWGYTRAWQTEYPVEIMQTPERLAILWESNNVFHIVPADGSGHPQELEPSWLGHSTGKYEGDTLVIDTIGFNGKTWIDTAQHPSSDALHIVERFRQNDTRNAN